MRKAGEGTINHSGHIIIYVNGRKRRLHRHIMEGIIGRPIKRSEVVHHIDGNPQNNSPENLKLCESQADHMKNHKKYFSDSKKKECSKCRVIKSRSEFGKQTQKSINDDSHACMCKICYGEYYKPYKKQHYIDNRERYLEWSRQQKQRIKHLA